MSKRIIITILLCGGLYLLGNGRVSLWDRDEPRYAQASRQMLQSGDWVVPKLLDEVRIKKPPMIYWCQAASMALFKSVLPDAGRSPEQRMERDAAAARLPSSIAIILTMLLIALVLLRIVGEEHAFWTVLVFGTSGLVIMAAKMCLTDGVLLLFVTASQFCLYAMYQKRATWPVVIAFGISTGLGLLTKGPVVLGINGMTLIVLGLMRVVDARLAKRIEPRGFEVVTQEQEGPHPSPLPEYRAREPENAGSIVTKVLLCIAIILAIGLPWVIVMWQRMANGANPAENGFWKIIKHEIFDRMTSPLEQHKGPPGYYLVYFLATFFPWCLMLPTAIKLAWQNRGDSLTRFAFAAVVGPWIMFECIATKLPHYVLPCFPFLAILTAQAIVRGIRKEHNEWNNQGWKIAVAVWSIAVIILGIAPWFATMKRFGFDRLPYGAMTIVTGAAVFFAVLVFIQFAKGKIASGAYSMAAATLELMALLFSTYLPSARFLHLSEEVGTYLQTINATQPHEVQMIDYKEDSLPFYQGGTIRPQPKNTFLATAPPQDWPEYLVITREIWDKTPASAKAHLELLKTFHGLAYAAKGRVVDVMVVKKKLD
jgi:4-amino-4-deoxy-L-arabinose transferase-like glycosyltransferase